MLTRYFFVAAVLTATIGGRVAVTIFSIIENYDRSSSILAMKNWIDHAEEVIIFPSNPEICLEIKTLAPQITCPKHDCLIAVLQKLQISCVFRSVESFLSNRSATLMYVSENVIFSSIKNAHRILLNYEQRMPIVAVGRSEYLTSSLALISETSINELQTVKNSDDNIDYFLFTRNSLPIGRMPRFVSGNDMKWRNWLLSEVLMRNESLVFDISNSLKAIRITQLPLDKFNVNKYNAQVWEYLHDGWKFYELGRLDYIDYTTDGTQVIHKEDNPQIHVIKSVYHAMHYSGFIYILTISSEQLPLLDNWLMWTDRIDFKTFLVFAMDFESFNTARQKNLLTYSAESVKLIEGMTFGEKYLVRNLFLQQLINVGLSFVTFSVDAIFLSNPFIDIFHGLVLGFLLQD